MNRTKAMHRTLLQQLGHRGWQRVGVQRLPEDSLSEVWYLESIWSPKGARAYLRFDLSPWEDTSSHLRVYRQAAETDGASFWWDDLSPRRRWRVALLPLFEELARIREQGRLEPPSPLSLGPEMELKLLRSKLDRLRDKLGDRRLRLFACACLRRLPHLFEEERNRLAIEAAEQYADRLIGKRELKKARKAARLPWLTSFDPFAEAVTSFQEAVRVTTVERQMILEDLLSDIAGNLDGAVTLRRCWLERNGGIIATMAQAIYTVHSFADLPILADALEEVGCTNAAILEHCRRPGEHARGCWVLDLLLGKTHRCGV